MKALFRTLAASLILAVGCDVVIDYPNQDDASRQPIRLSISQTADTTFEAGDAAGIYVVDSYDNDNYYVDNASLTFYDGAWQCEEQLYWDESCTLADVCCYIPYSTVYFPTIHKFSIETNQSSYDDYKASDFLWGKKENIEPDAETVRLDLKHLMSRLVISLEPGSGYTKDELRDATVTINPNRSKVNINLLNGDLSQDNAATTTVNPYYNTNDRKYYAVLVPEVIEDKDFIEVVTAGGKTYKLHQSYMDMQPGKQYNCTITLNKTGYGIDIGISDWEVDDTDFGGTLN